MRSVGIDQSYTGCAIWTTDGGSLNESHLIKTEKQALPFDIFNRAAFVADSVLRICQMFEADRICIEGLAFASFGDATRNLAGLQFMILDRLLVSGFKDILIVPPTTLKKFALKGNAKKEEMYDVLPEDIKTKISTYLKTKGRYDVTDAYYLAQYGLRGTKDGSDGDST